MYFIFFILTLAFVNAQETIIETPDENQIALLNITKDIDTEDLFTQTNVTVTVSVTNPGPLNISNVVIYDEIPPFMKLYEGENNTIVFDLVPVGATVNLTYVAVPILSGIHYLEGASVNFTYNRTRRQEFSYDLGEMYIQQYKGVISISIEWAVIVIILCAFYLLWVMYKSKKHANKQKLLRAKGYATAVPNVSSSPKSPASPKVAEKPEEEKPKSD